MRAMHLEHRDVEIVYDDATEQEILGIEVRGKRGVGFCKSTPMAVEPYRRLLSRPKPPTPEDHEKIRPLSRAERKAWLEKRAADLPRPTDKLFPRNHITITPGVAKRDDRRALAARRAFKPRAGLASIRQSLTRMFTRRTSNADERGQRSDRVGAVVLSSAGSAAEGDVVDGAH
jgi:hypothetical protein